MNSMIIDELRSEIKGDVGRWEEAVVEWAQGIARYLAGGVLAALDEELIAHLTPWAAA